MKNNNYFRYILWALLLCPIVFITSCIKDEGNYIYTTVEGIAVDTLGTVGTELVTYRQIYLEFSNAELGNRLRYKPVVIYDKDPSKLEYSWFIYDYYYGPVQEGNVMVYPPAITICRTHELDWIVDAVPGRYNMQFMVVDPETGLSAYQWFYLNIPRAGARTGLYALSEYNGQSDIDLYGSRLALIIGGDHFTPKFYSSQHDGNMIPGKPRFIYFSQPNPNNFGEYVYYAFTEQEGLRLHAQGLAVMESFDQMFYNAPVYNPQAMKFKDNGEFLINDGNLHVLYNNRPNDRKFSVPIAGNYKAASYLQKDTRTTWGAVPGAINSEQIIFDELSNSFRPYFPLASSVGYFNQTAPGAFLDANNLGSKPTYIFEISDGRTCAIMRINGRDSLYVFRFFNRVDEGDLSALGANSRQSLEGCEGISQAKFYASSPAGAAFFYATTNKVYSYSVTSGQTTQNNIWECGPNEEVTALYQLGSGGFPTAGCVLWIGVWNNLTNTGKMVEFEVDPVGGVVRTQWINMFAPGQTNPRITEGFGKIKSMVIAM